MKEKRLIYVNAALEKVCENCGCDFEECKQIGFCVDYTNIEQLPTVDAVEVVHGVWLDAGKNTYGQNLTKCSVCKSNSIEGGLYCRCCGAKMRN